MRTLVIALLAAAALIDGPSAVSGRVVADESGDPIGGARVRVTVDGRTTPFVVTDHDGRFTVTPPQPSGYTLTAIKSGYVTRDTVIRQPIGTLELRLARAAVISGRVVDRVGDPIVDARVAADSPPGTNGASHTLAVATTDDTGEFRLAGLPVGPAIVSVMTMAATPTGSVAGRGIVTFEPKPTKTYYPGTTLPESAATIDVVAGEEHDATDIVVEADQTGGTIFLFTAAVRPADATSANTPGTSAIRGRVSSIDGRPLPRAQVRLMPFGLPAPTGSVRSDDDGRFVFADVPPGKYRVAAAKAGYAPQKSSEFPFFGTPVFGATPAFELHDGSVRNDIDVSLARLGTVTGFVFDELGDPAQGATVQLLQARFERGRRRLVAAGTPRPADDRGRYRIFDVAPGQYLVVASVGALVAPGVAATDLPGYAPSYYPGGPDARAAQFVAVDATQEVTGIDFSLTPTRTALVSGKILNAVGEPTTAGTLQLRPVGSAESVAGVPMAARLTPGGVFEFTNVAPGPYVIYADRGRQNASVEGEFAAMPVVVTGDDLIGLTVQMSAGSSVAGRIAFDAVDVDERPPTGDIELTAVPVDSDTAPANVAHADIARDWTFQMRGLNGERRLLPTRLPPGWALREVRVNGVDATDRPISLGRRDQSRSDVEVVLTDRVAVAEGTVVDGDSHPVPNALVLAFAVDRDRRHPWSRFVHHTTTAGNGSFVLTSMPGGSYYIAAVSALPLDGDDAWQDAAFLESLVPSAATLSVSDGERQTINLRLR